MLPVHNSFGVQGFLACDRYVFTFARSAVMPIAVQQPPGVRRLMRKGPLSRAHSETVPGGPAVMLSGQSRPEKS